MTPNEELEPGTLSEGTFPWSMIFFRPGGPVVSSLLILIGYSVLSLSSPDWSRVLAIAFWPVIWVVLSIGLNYMRLTLGPSRTFKQILDGIDMGVGSVGVSALVAVVAVLLAWVEFGNAQGMSVAACVLATSVLCLMASKELRPSQAGDTEPTQQVPPEDGTGYRWLELAWDLSKRTGGKLSGSAGTYLSQERAAEARAANPGTKFHEDGTFDLASYVTPDGRCEEVDNLVAGLSQSTRDLGLDNVLEVEMVLNMVQQIEYRRDEETTGKADYWRYPIETLDDEVGDCEDSSILTAALLSGLGYKVAMLYLPQHAAVGVAGLDRGLGAPIVHAGDFYQFAETTATGWGIGKYPDDVTPKEIKVVGVVEPLSAHQESAEFRMDERNAWRTGSRLLMIGTGIGAATSLACFLLVAV